MFWLIGIICFAIGLCTGALLFKQFKSDEARVRQLEQSLQSLQSEHDSYKENVHTHFSNTAELMNTLTDSYKEVYKHMALGAQSLCPEYISQQLSHSPQAQNMLASEEGFSADKQADTDAAPPRDYATKASPDQKGNLAEDYGLEKMSAGNDPEPESSRLENTV